MITGAKLFQAVEKCRAPAAFWWLGQASYVVKLGRTVALIDPFLTPMKGRRVPPLFAAEDAGIVDLVVCTHDHIDHIDPLAVSGLARTTGATFVAPRAHARRMRSLGVASPRFVGLNDGESASVRGITLHGIKASHEFFDRTPGGLYPYLGYVFQGAGRTLYHSGDTVWWEGLQARLSRWKFDAVLLPINGRDAVRFRADCLGNMVYQEAGDLAGGLKVKLTVPMHYDMFAFNAEDPRLFVDYMRTKYPRHRVWVGPPTTLVRF